MDSNNSIESANNFSAPNETRSIHQTAPNSSVEFLLRKLFNAFNSESLSADGDSSQKPAIEASNHHHHQQQQQQFEGNLLLLMALLVFINLIVIFGNILVILAVYATAKLRNVTNIFTVSLATADLLLGIFVLPYAVMFEILDVWVFGKVWCRGWLVADVWISTASILNLCAISVDRYVAVTRPVRYRSIMTPRRAKTIVAGVWIVSFLICCPPLWPQWEPSATSITPSQLNRMQPETEAPALTNPIEVNKSRRLQPTIVGHQFQSVSASRDQLENSTSLHRNIRAKKGAQTQKLNTKSDSQWKTLIEIEPRSVLQSDLELTNDSGARSDNQKKDKRQVNLNDKSKFSKIGAHSNDWSTIQGLARESESMIATPDNEKKSATSIRISDESGNENGNGNRNRIEDSNRIDTRPMVVAGARLGLSSSEARGIYDKNGKRTRGKVENHSIDDQNGSHHDNPRIGSLESNFMARVRRGQHIINSLQGSPSHLEPNAKRVDPWQPKLRPNQPAQTTKQTLASQQKRQQQQQQQALGSTTTASANNKPFGCGPQFHQVGHVSSGGGQQHETDCFHVGPANKVDSRASGGAVTIEPINERIRSATMEAKQVNGVGKGGSGSGSGSENGSRGRITRSLGRKMVHHARARPQNDREKQNEHSPRLEQLVDLLAIIVIDNGRLLQVATGEAQRDFGQASWEDETSRLRKGTDSSSQPNASRDNNSGSQKYKQERTTLTLIESLLLASLEYQNGSLDSHCGCFNITEGKKHSAPRTENARLSTNANNRIERRDQTTTTTTTADNYSDITDADRVERNPIILAARLAIGSNNNETILLMAKMGKNSEIAPQLERTRSMANPGVWGAIQTSAISNRIKDAFNVMSDQYRANNSKKLTTAIGRKAGVRGLGQSKLNSTTSDRVAATLAVFMGEHKSNLLADIPRVERHKDETILKTSRSEEKFYMKIKLLNRNGESNKHKNMHKHSDDRGGKGTGSSWTRGRQSKIDAPSDNQSQTRERESGNQAALRESSQMLPLLLYINLVGHWVNSTSAQWLHGNDDELQVLACNSRATIKESQIAVMEKAKERARQTAKSAQTLGIPNGLINDDLAGLADLAKTSTIVCRNRNGKRAQSNTKLSTKIDTKISDNNTECNRQIGCKYLAYLLGLVVDDATADSRQGHENRELQWSEMLSSVINSYKKLSRLYRLRHQHPYSNECWPCFYQRFCKNITSKPSSYQTNPFEANQNEPLRQRQRKRIAKRKRRRRQRASQQSNRRETFHKYSGCCSYDIRDTNGLDTHCCFLEVLFEDLKACDSKLHELDSGDKIAFFVKMLDIWLCGSIEHNLYYLGLICRFSGSGFKSNMAYALDEKLNSIDPFNRLNLSYRHSSDLMEVMIYAQLFDLGIPKLKTHPELNSTERPIKDKQATRASISEAPNGKLELVQNLLPPALAASLSGRKSMLPAPEVSKPTPMSSIDRKIVNKREVKKIESSDLVDSNGDDDYDNNSNNNNNKQPNDGNINGRKDKNKLNDYLININMSASDLANGPDVKSPSGVAAKGGANRVDKAKVKRIDSATASVATTTPTSTTTTTSAPSSYVPIYGYRAQNKKSGCALYDHKPYVIYSASGSFYIPMLIMIFFYSRIYLVASRAQKNLQRGYMTTKWPVNAKTRLESAASGISGNHEGEANSADYCNLSGPNLERVTLRIHRRQVSSTSSNAGVVGPSAGSDKSNGTPSRTNSSELVRLASEKANQSLKSQLLSSGLTKANSNSNSNANATDSNGSKGVNCKRIRRQSPVECEDKDDTVTSVGPKKDTDTRLDATTSQAPEQAACRETSNEHRVGKSSEDLRSMSMDHSTNQTAQDLTESTTTLTSGSCQYEIEPVHSSLGGKQRRHAYQHHSHHHSLHQHQHQHQHQHRHHRRHHRHHHHHHDNSGQSNSHVSNATDDRRQNTPTENGNQVTAECKDPAIECGLHQHIRRHHRHRHHRHARLGGGGEKSRHHQGCRELRDRQQSCDDAYLAPMNSSTRHELVALDLVEQLGQCTSIAEETRANSSSSINKSTNMHDKQMDPTKHVQITLSLVNEPRPEPELAHKSEVAIEASGCIENASDAHLDRTRPIFVAITPPPFEIRPQLDADGELESQSEQSVEAALDEQPSVQRRAHADPSREACLTIGQSSCSEQPSRTDRSHSCGPETPTIVVNWNSPSQMVENQLSKQKIMATSEQTLPTRLELAQHSEQLEGAHTSLGSNGRPRVDTPGAESLGSGLSLFPMAANQVRKQSIMLFNSITARGSETLRRLSMVAHHPVESLLRRSKSHTCNSSDERHSSSDEHSGRPETSGTHKKTRKRQRKKKRKRKHEHKRTIDDYLMAVAGIDTSSIDEDLGFTGDEQGFEDDEIDDNIDIGSDDDDDDERNLSDDKMNLTALLQCERVNLPCVNVIEPVEDRQLANELPLASDGAKRDADQFVSSRGGNDKSGHEQPLNENDHVDVSLGTGQQKRDIRSTSDPIDSSKQIDETSRVKQLNAPEQRNSGQSANLDDKSSVIVSITNNGPVSSLRPSSQQEQVSKSASLEPVVLARPQLKRTPRNGLSGRRRGAKRATLWHAKRLRAETKAAKTVAIIIGGFIFCWLPFFTAYLSRAIICTSPDCIPQSLLSLFIWLGYLNSAINPVIYGLVSADFRQAFKNILCRCRVRNNTKNTRVVSVLVDNIIKSMGV